MVSGDNGIDRKNISYSLSLSLSINIWTYLQVAGDDVRNKINAAALSLIEALDQGYGNGIWLDLAQQLLAEIGYELMGHYENEYVGILGSFD